MADEREQRLNTFITSYKRNKNKYSKYANHILERIKATLEVRQIFIAYSSAREKDIDSLTKKCNNMFQNETGELVYKYTDFRNQIMDLAGVRIVTYLLEDVEEVSKAIYDLFDVLEQHSGDKLDLLGADKIGYLSVHYIVKLKDNMIATDEEVYKGLKCEIQIRTALEDAWAQIFHDRQYKNSCELLIPEKMIRRTNLLSGNLELLDYQINELVNIYDELNQTNKSKQLKTILELPISKRALLSYIKIKFGKAVAFFNYKLTSIILKKFGIKSIRTLDTVLQDIQCETEIKEHLDLFTADKIIFNMLIIKDRDKFLEIVGSNVVISGESYDFLTKFIDIDEACEKHGIIIQNRRQGNPDE